MKIEIYTVTSVSIAIDEYDHDVHGEMGTGCRLWRLLPN